MANETERVFFVLGEELDAFNDRMVDTAIKVPVDVKDALERAGRLIKTADKELKYTEMKVSRDEASGDTSNDVLIRAHRKNMKSVIENRRIALLDAITRKNPEKYENQTYSEWTKTIDEAIERWPTRWELTIEGARPVETLKIATDYAKATLKGSDSKVKNTS